MCGEGIWGNIPNIGVDNRSQKYYPITEVREKITFRLNNLNNTTVKRLRLNMIHSGTLYQKIEICVMNFWQVIFSNNFFFAELATCCQNPDFRFAKINFFMQNIT